MTDILPTKPLQMTIFDQKYHVVSLSLFTSTNIIIGVSFNRFLLVMHFEIAAKFSVNIIVNPKVSR